MDAHKFSFSKRPSGSGSGLSYGTQRQEWQFWKRNMLSLTAWNMTVAGQASMPPSPGLCGTGRPDALLLPACLVADGRPKLAPAPAEGRVRMWAVGGEGAKQGEARAAPRPDEVTIIPTVIISPVLVPVHHHCYLLYITEHLLPLCQGREGARTGCPLRPAVPYIIIIACPSSVTLGARCVRKQPHACPWP